jgi:hypothetical protein
MVNFVFYAIGQVSNLKQINAVHPFRSPIARPADFPLKPLIDSLSRIRDDDEVRWPIHRDPWLNFSIFTVCQIALILRNKIVLLPKVDAECQSKGSSAPPFVFTPLDC